MAGQPNSPGVKIIAGLKALWKTHGFFFVNKAGYLNPYFWWVYRWGMIGWSAMKTHIQGGPLVSYGVITPTSRGEMTPVAHLITAIYRGYN